MRYSPANASISRKEFGNRSLSLSLGRDGSEARASLNDDGKVVFYPCGGIPYTYMQFCCVIVCVFFQYSVKLYGEDKSRFICQMSPPTDIKQKLRGCIMDMVEFR